MDAERQVLHVVTVHWQSDAWIEPQLRFLHRFTPRDTRLYAALDGVDPAHRSRFDYACEIDGTHPEKLNALAHVVAERAEPEDLLLFLDGDAFPIAPVTPEVLAGFPLAAVRRDENLGDPQPHPCFCLTTVGFWTAIGGDWRRGYLWRNTAGEQVTDVGGRLLWILTERGSEWRPLLRTNKVNLHPLWFALYGNVAYHHGAGFRERLARTDDLPTAGKALRSALTPAWVPLIAGAERRTRRYLAERQRRRWLATAGADAEALADEVYRSIIADDEFWRRFA